MKQTTCLIFDPDSLSQESIKTIVQSNNSELLFITVNAVQQLNQTQKSISALDYAICRLDGGSSNPFDVLTDIRAFFPRCRLLVISKNQSTKFMAVLREFGVTNVINPNSPYQAIQQAIHAFIHSEPTQNDDSIRSTNCLFKLTQRQQEVMEWILQGFSNKRIAWELGVSEGTIKLHVSSILRELQVNNRTEAAMKYQKFTMNIPTNAQMLGTNSM